MGIYQGIPRSRLEGRLEIMTVPTPVITGDDDQIVPLENGLQLAKDIPGASLAVIENYGQPPRRNVPGSSCKQ
jgi:pimeloyl-ACP methyl ester carboxylesterase